jgi:uncharacterized BrkB/YihY/UPF0761 family membrane protein
VDTSALPAIPGESVDPPAKALPKQVTALESRGGRIGGLAGLTMRTSTRFVVARATLLAAGTTYYLFLALFSILTLAYGLTAALGAEQLSAYITEAVSAAFPGLVGQNGIDPDVLRSTAQVTSIVSAVGLLYGATGAVMGASRSLHALYGAPNNTRNFVLVRFWAVGWFLVLAPLVLLSFVSASVTANLFDRILDALGLRWSGPTPLLDLTALTLTLLLNFVVVRLMLGRLGGIRPARRPLIGILFVLYLQAMALYAVASLTAALAETRSAPVT